MNDDGYPMRLYVYGHNGRHSGGTWLYTEAELHDAMTTVVKPALADKREVRITDSGDCMIFHAENGRIVWPTAADLAAGRGGR